MTLAFFHPLRRLFGRATVPQATVPDPVPAPLPRPGPPGVAPEVAPAARRNFATLLILVYGHLPVEQAAAEVDAGLRMLTRGDELEEAFRAALLKRDQDQAFVKNGFMSVHGNVPQEVQWQAQMLCRAHGLREWWLPPAMHPAFLRELAKQDGGPVAALLREFGRWLRNQGVVLFYIASGDSLLAFVVREADQEKVGACLDKLGIAHVLTGQAGAPEELPALHLS